jgi:hypothetical protein
LLNYFCDFMKQPLFGKNDAIEWQNDKIENMKKSKETSLFYRCF